MQFFTNTWYPTGQNSTGGYGTSTFTAPSMPTYTQQKPTTFNFGTFTPGAAPTTPTITPYTTVRPEYNIDVDSLYETAYQKGKSKAQELFGYNLGAQMTPGSYGGGKEVQKMGKQRAETVMGLANDLFSSYYNTAAAKQAQLQQAYDADFANYYNQANLHQQQYQNNYNNWLQQQNLGWNQYLQDIQNQMTQAQWNNTINQQNFENQQQQYLAAMNNYFNQQRTNQGYNTPTVVGSPNDYSYWNTAPNQTGAQTGNNYPSNIVNSYYKPTSSYNPTNQQNIQQQQQQNFYPSTFSNAGSFVNSYQTPWYNWGK